MIHRRRILWALVFALTVVTAGCSGDVSTLLSSNAGLRDKVMHVIGGNGAFAGQMVDKLLAADSTKSIVIERLFANGGAVQEVLVRVAKDHTMIDGVLDLAVQDSSMRSHVLTLLRGMEMGAAKPR